MRMISKYDNLISGYFPVTSKILEFDILYLKFGVVLAEFDVMQSLFI